MLPCASFLRHSHFAINKSLCLTRKKDRISENTTENRKTTTSYDGLMQHLCFNVPRLSSGVSSFMTTDAIIDNAGLYIRIFL